MSKWGVGLFLATTLVAGCNGEDSAGDTCSFDFDCKVSEICKIDTASSNSTGVCEKAAAGQKRLFGRQTLNFVSGQEVFLLGVYALPTEDASPDGFVQFSLGQGAAKAQLRPVKNALIQKRFDPFSTAQSRFDSWRYQKIGEYLNDVKANSSIGVSRQALAAPACSPTTCTGTDKMCWKGTCTSSVTLTFVDRVTPVACTLAGVIPAAAGTVPINVLVENGAPLGSDAAARNAAADFAKSFARELNLLGQTGHTGSLDRDGDGRLTLVFSNHEGGEVTAQVVGYFDFQDFLDSAQGSATKNEADLLWARIPGTGAITQLKSVGTLAHEYMHMVSYSSRIQARGSAPLAQESRWLDEGMAHLMEDLSGWGPSNVGAVEAALNAWPTTVFAGPNDPPEQRGQAYLLLRHLVDQAAKKAGASSALGAAVDVAAKAVYAALLNESEVGFKHSLFQTAGATTAWDWILGVYSTGRTDLRTEAHQFDYLTPGIFAATSNLVGIDTHGTFQDADDATVTLTGPKVGDGSTEQIDSWASPLESEVPLSGSVLFEVIASGPGTVIVEGKGDAAVDLHLGSQWVSP